MPGGTSSSFLSVDVVVDDGGGGDDLEERSTGSWLLVPALFLVAGGDILGEGTEDEVVSVLEGRRGLNKFPVVGVNGGCVDTGGGVVGAGPVLGGI